MRVSKNLLLLIPFFLLLACQSATPASDQKHKSLKLVKTDKAAAQVWYIPTRAIISGPGNATAPFELRIGSDRLIQGMLSLKEDEAELQALAEQLRKKHGRAFELKKDLTANINVKLAFEEKTLWQHNLLAGSQGLPFQIQLPADKKAQLSVVIEYKPGLNGQTEAKTFSFTRQTTHTVSNNEKAGEESFIASFSTESEATQKAEFCVEQILEL